MKAFLLITFGIILGFLSIGLVGANWQRLKQAECLKLEGDGGVEQTRVCIVWDELEKTNCYVVVNEGNRGSYGVKTNASSISCIKKY